MSKSMFRQMAISLGVLILAFVFVFPHWGCAKKGIKAQPDRVIMTSHGKSKRNRPDWAIKEPRYVKKKILYVSGRSTIMGDQARNQGLKGADLDAKAKLAAEISARVKQQIQSAAEGFDMDNQTIRDISSIAVDRKHLTGVYIEENYWEQIGYYSEHNPDVEKSRYDCYSLAAIPLDELKKQISMAWKEYEDSQKGGNVDKRMRKRFEESWDNTFQADSRPAL
jgi:hypothetical protein